MQKKFKIEVDCANCAAKIEDAVKKLPGVNSASVSRTLRSSCKLLASAFSDGFQPPESFGIHSKRRTCADAWNTLQAKKQVRVPSGHENMLLCGRVVPKEGCRSVAQPHCGEPHLCSVELL